MKDDKLPGEVWRGSTMVGLCALSCATPEGGVLAWGWSARSEAFVPLDGFGRDVAIACALSAALDVVTAARTCVATPHCLHEAATFKPCVDALARFDGSGK